MTTQNILHKKNKPIRMGTPNNKVFRDNLQFKNKKKEHTNEREKKKNEPLDEYLTFLIFILYCPFGKIYYKMSFMFCKTFNIFRTNLI